MPDDSLVRPYPFKTCPLIPVRFLGTPEQQVALADGIHAEVDRLAAARGYRRGRLTRTNINRMMPGLPQSAVAALALNPRAEVGPGDTFAAREVAARKLKQVTLREICAKARAWRHSTVYFEGGRPVSLLSYMQLSASDTFVRQLFSDQGWVADGWGLEMRLSSKYWFINMFECGLEVCRPGCSVFGDEGPCDGLMEPLLVGDRG